MLLLLLVMYYRTSNALNLMHTPTYNFYYQFAVCLHGDLIVLLFVVPTVSVVLCTVHMAYSTIPV